MGKRPEDEACKIGYGYSIDCSILLGLRDYDGDVGCISPRGKCFNCGIYKTLVSKAQNNLSRSNDQLEPITEEK